MVRACIFLFVLTLGAATAIAQPDPSGIDFVTVGAPGNAPWTGGGFNNNRGQVDYEFRIGRYEVTTAQWAEFMNAALDRPVGDRIPHVFAPTQWGAVGAAPQNGGQRFAVPAGNEMLPAGGVDWRTSAIYCNWLHNDKGSNREAFLSGAYEVSTFGQFGMSSGFTDQLTRSPGARYFIPSLDEWMKASHFDPHRNGPGQGGWWLYSNSSDNPYVYGPPGVLFNGVPCNANAAWDQVTNPGHNPFNVLLGAYSGVTTPWGMYDAAGGTSEWIEEVFQLSDEPAPRFRYFEGSAWTWGFGESSDHVRNPRGAEFPSYFGYDMGFRVAATVPSPGCTALLGIGVAWSTRRRRTFVV